MQRLLLILTLIISYSASAQRDTIVVIEREVRDNDRYSPDTFSYNGNFFRSAPHRMDTVMVVDPETGKMKIVLVPTNVYPVRMNNDTIYNIDADSTNAVKNTIKEIFLSITDAMKPQLEKLGDGGYTLSVDAIVIDDKGKLVYIDYKEINAMPYPIPPELKIEIEKKMKELFAAQKAWPIYKVKDKPSLYLAQYNQNVYVYNHHMRL